MAISRVKLLKAQQCGIGQLKIQLSDLQCNNEFLSRECDLFSSWLWRHHQRNAVTWSKVCKKFSSNQNATSLGIV